MTTTTILKRWLLPALMALALSGCATRAIDVNDPVKDPFESVNRTVYGFNDKLDRYALKPLAQGYKGLTPGFVRQGVGNFFGNLSDVTVAINVFLQGKFEQGLHDTARVAVNTTLGLGGIFDVATALKLPRHEEDFGQTLAVWGVPEGPYLVLPFFGSRTLRGTAGLLVDSEIAPLNNLNFDSSTRSNLVALNVVNARAKYLAATSILETAALDPYTFVRDSYVKRRRRLVNDGRIAPAPAKVRSSQSVSQSGRDELDELDELDEIDQLDEIDRLDETDEIDRLDEMDEIDRLDEIDEAEPLDEIDELDQLD